MAEISIYKKLANIQRQLFVPKGQTNNFGHYNYRSCEDILVKVKPLCDEQGLVLTLHDEIVCMNNGECYIKSRAEIFDVDNGESMFCDGWAREAATQGGMVPAQISGATSSYARKYALNGLFAIDNTKDADTDEYQRELRKNPSNTVSDTKVGFAEDIKKSIDNCTSKQQIIDYMNTLDKSSSDYKIIREYAGKKLNTLTK